MGFTMEFWMDGMPLNPQDTHYETRAYSDHQEIRSDQEQIRQILDTVFDSEEEGIECDQAKDFDYLQLKPAVEEAAPSEKDNLQGKIDIRICKSLFPDFSESHKQRDSPGGTRQHFGGGISSEV